MTGRDTRGETILQQIERTRRATRQAAVDETVDHVGLLIALLHGSEVPKMDWRAEG
jgi:hypothetical protein